MIDEISLNILKILQKKARIPNVEVARQVGMAPSAVLERSDSGDHRRGSASERLEYEAVDGVSGLGGALHRM